LKLYCKKFQIEKEEVSLESTIHALGSGSIDVIGVIFIIEKDFGISIPDSRC